MFDLGSLACGWIGGSRMSAAMAFIAALCAAATVTAGVAVPTYTLTALGDLPGGVGAGSQAINDAGQVIGSDSINGTTHSFLYSNGTVTDLDPNAGVGVLAYGINNSGQVVGTLNPGAGGQAFLYRKGSIQVLSFGPGILAADAFGINDRGQIVGGYTPQVSVGPSDSHAYLYTSGTAQTIKSADEPVSLAFGINSSGVVVGAVASEFGDFTPTIYSNGNLQVLTALGGGDSWAVGVNDKGQVVGGSHNNAFLYSNGVSTDIGTPGIYSEAEGINDSGQIVGLARISTDPNSPTYGFVYLNGTMCNLNDLVVNGSGYDIINAEAINSSGQIAATAITASGEGGAVLLTPAAAPLPPAVWLAACTLPLALRGRRLLLRKRAKEKVNFAHPRRRP